MTRNRKMSKNTQLIIQFQGLEQDDGEVRLDYLADELKTLQKVFRVFEKSVGTGAADNLVYKVVDAKHGSPLSVTLEVTSNGHAQTGLEPRVFERFFDTLSDRSNSAVEKKSETQMDAAIDTMIHKSEERFYSVEIEHKGNRIQTIPGTQTKTNKTFSQDITSWGTVKGRIERYNNHGNSNFFWLYTALGTAVKCAFSDELVEQSASSVEKNASVTGMLTYRLNEPMPCECKVEKIEIHKPDDQLPKLKIGKFPNITEGESTSRFIQRIRDDWE